MRSDDCILRKMNGDLLEALVLGEGKACTLTFLDSLALLAMKLGLLVASFHPAAVATCYSLLMDLEPIIVKALEEYQNTAQLVHLDIGDSGELVAKPISIMKSALRDLWNAPDSS